MKYMYVQEQGVGSTHNMTVFEVAHASFRERPDLSPLGKDEHEHRVVGQR